jgi:ubiquitin fusion degradation protein 1
MLDHLCIEDGELIQIKNVSLPLATFSKFQPQSVDFLDITNPKAVLELKLRYFACLTKGDIIRINYNDKNYELLVLETTPGDAVSIIECDMKVDFAAPVGYVDPPPPSEPMDTTDSSEPCVTDSSTDSGLPHREFKAFYGQGQRLDGKDRRKSDVNDNSQQLKRLSITSW